MSTCSSCSSSQSASISSTINIALLKKANDMDKDTTLELLPVQPPVPSSDPNVGRKLDVYS